MSVFIATVRPRTARQSIGRTVIAAAARIAFPAFPVLAQDGTGPVPDNAEARNYGGGLNSALGCRADDAECVAINIPQNAYATGRSYGSGWACRRGHEEVGGIACEAIPVPANAFLRSSGFGRQCERGFAASERVCAPIAVPENRYLTIAAHGAEWACESGFFEIDGRCDPVALPANSYLDPYSYGPGWHCEEEYEGVDDACIAIDLPANAHLDRSGNRWRCDRGFQLSNGECVLGR